MRTRATIGLCGLLFCVWALHAVAQTAPLKFTSSLAWYMSDGTSAAIAQTYEPRVRVDGAATATVLSGVTCAASSLTDGAGGVWTFGAGTPPSIVILRNGTQAAGAFGAQMALVGGTLFLQGDDLAYYRWTGSAFAARAAADPTPAALDAVAVTRWDCSAPMPAAMVRQLNVYGPHSVILRLAEPVAKLIESADSLPFLLTTPVTVTQPVRVTIK